MTNKLSKRSKRFPFSNSSGKYGLYPAGLFDEMNDVFDDIFDARSPFANDHLMPLSAISQRLYVVVADDEKLEISVDIPGVKQSGLDVSVTGNEVFVTATRNDQKQTYSWLVRQEYDSSNPKAHLEDGVLTLTFQKRPEAKARKVEVTSA